MKLGSDLPPLRSLAVLSLASTMLARSDAGYLALPYVFHGTVRNVFLGLTQFTLNVNLTVPNTTNLLLNI